MLFCSVLLMAEAVSSATFQCLPCPPGRISSSGGGCADCAVGTYSPGIGRASCDAIPAGHRCLVSYGQSTGTSAGCIDTTPCLAGTYRLANQASNTCASCPPGQTSPQGSTSQNQCYTPCQIPGMWLNGDACQTCPANSWCSGDGSRTPCANELESPAGSSVLLDCKRPCAPGYRNNGVLNCAICTKNNYCPGNGLMYPCPDYGTTVSTGASSLYDCCIPRWPNPISPPSIDYECAYMDSSLQCRCSLRACGRTSNWIQTGFGDSCNFFCEDICKRAVDEWSKEITSWN